MHAGLYSSGRSQDRQTLAMTPGPINGVIMNKILLSLTSVSTLVLVQGLHYF